MSFRLARYMAGAALAAAVCLVPAMAQTADQKTDSGSGKMMKSADAKFVRMAAQGGLAEVQLGQMAAQKGTNADVKSFGQHMVDDHTKANDDLKAIAAKEGMTVPESLNPKDQALQSKLQNLSGAEFDRAYMKAMVKDHQEDVKEFQKLKEALIVIGNESKGISDEIMQLANEKITIPKLGEAESLNAAVAAGIILSHVT